MNTTHNDKIRTMRTLLMSTGVVVVLLGAGQGVPARPSIAATTRSPVARAQVGWLGTPARAATNWSQQTPPIAPYQGTDSYLTANYLVTKVTSGSFDHKWPSINNNGDIVWSQQVNGLWQVYLLKNGATSPTPLPVPNMSYNREYPDIDDNGGVVYLEDGQGAGPGLSVVENIGGVESTIEYSSGNPPGCTEPPAGPATCKSWRAAGQYFGIAGNGTVISYHDFCNVCSAPPPCPSTSSSCTRNFDVSGVGQLAGTWNGADYPDINGQGTFVYTTAGSVYSATTAAPTSPTLIASGGNPRIADASINPEIVYIAAGQVISTLGGPVDSGIWADVGSSGTILFERKVKGYSQVFRAVPISRTWAGYVSLGSNVTDVKGQWVVPSVSCSGGTQESATWVGIDGYPNTNPTVEQEGTAQACASGLPRYWSWYEIYPSAPVPTTMTVSPGNTITAETMYLGNNQFELILHNLTTGGSFSTTQSIAASRSSAEWIEEAPLMSSGSIWPLANFGTMQFTNAQATIGGSTGALNSFGNLSLTMVNNSAQVKAQPSGLGTGGDNFTVTWLRGT